MDICRQNIRHRKELWVMSRKGENIYKRKDGRWEGRYIKADCFINIDKMCHIM